MIELSKNLRGKKLRRSNFLIAVFALLLVFGNRPLFCGCKLPEHLLTEVSAPLHLEQGDLAPVTAFLAAGAVCFAVDRTVNDGLASLRAQNLDLLKNADIFGDGYFTLGAASVLYVLGGPKEKNTALNVAESFIEAGLLTGVLKLGFGRRRPDSGSDAFTFEPFGFNSDSLPSGHTAVAFSTAAVLAKAYDIGYITYPLAACVGFSRMYKEKHWLSDVFFGAVIGTLVGNLHEPEKEKDLKATFEYNGTGMSFIISKNF